MRLKGKVAIITGGASGIGAETTKTMVREGARVAIADLDEEKGQALAHELGDSATFIKTDVTNEESVEYLVDITKENFGALDILVNNAGIGHMGEAEDYSAEDWDKVVKINLTGVFNCAKFAIRAMKDTGGSIVNLGSILGNVGQANTAAYSAAKGGVVNLTRTLALEVAKYNIRVNSVSPGYIDTPMLSQVPEELRDELISRHPLGRLGRPQEIANAVTFLASDDASFVTGSDLLVDGGYTAGK